MFKQHFLIWFALFVVASLLGYFDALSWYYFAYQDGTAYLRWDVALSWYLIKWNLWVLLAPVVLRLGQRFPIDKKFWLRRVPVYVAAGAGVPLVHSLLHFFIHFVVVNDDSIFQFPTEVAAFLEAKYYVVVFDYLNGVLIYNLMLAAGHALGFYRQAREHELRRAEAETELALAQLEALKMQLHPHFLFNTLNSISASLREPETTRRMIARLADFLRLTLASQAAQEVTLRQELDFVRCYLDIEKTRFRERLIVEIEVAAETWDAAVPNLILQPLIENAVKHSVAQRSRGGRINIRAERLNNSLRLQVQDDGDGLVESVTAANLVGTNCSAKSLDNPNGASSVSTTGIGLKMTRARLAKLYPEQHRLELQNTVEGGFLVTLELPFKVCASNSNGEKLSVLKVTDETFEL